MCHKDVKISLTSSVIKEIQGKATTWCHKKKMSK